MKRLERKIRRFATEKLARQLYECVECHVVPRAEMDWLTAERFLDANPVISSYLIGCLFYAKDIPREKEMEDQIQFLLKQDFGYLEHWLGRNVWNIAYQEIKPCLPASYGRIWFE